MVYAPIIIPTLCRDVHFIRCVESLKRNSWAKYTDVYIGLDFPTADSHWNGYQKICSYLDNSDFSAFHKFCVIRREKNYGSAENSKALRKYVMERYDCFIRTDDDIEFSPNFIEYIDKGLEATKSNEKVIAVAGYSYPVDWRVSEGSNCFLEDISAPMWGIGFWNDKFLEFESYIKNNDLINDFKDNLTNGCRKRMIDRAWGEYIRGVTLGNPSTSYVFSCSDVSLRILLAIKDRFVLTPILSKARNWGFDGSGVTCQSITVDDGKLAKNYPYSKQPIDLDNAFDMRIDTLNSFQKNREIYNRFDANIFPRRKQIIRTALYLILGQKLYRRLFNFACSIVSKRNAK